MFKKDLSKLTEKFEERLSMQERRDKDQDSIMQNFEEALAMTNNNIRKTRQAAATNSNIRKQIELES